MVGFLTQCHGLFVPAFRATFLQQSLAAVPLAIEPDSSLDNTQNPHTMGPGELAREAKATLELWGKLEVEDELWVFASCICPQWELMKCLLRATDGRFEMERMLCASGLTLDMPSPSTLSRRKTGKSGQTYDTFSFGDPTLVTTNIRRHSCAGGGMAGVLV